MIGKCKLCEKETELCKSHIIPEFFYDKIYDIKPRKFWFFILNSKESYKKQEQKGLREYLLCKTCEKEFSVYEKYAAEIIYAKNRRSPVLLQKKSGTENVTLNEFNGFDYDKFKLFLMSILWRISISSEKFNVVEISEEHKNILHQALKDKRPLDEDEYPCTLQIILQADNSSFGGTIIGPYETQYNGHQVINILADGFLFSFILGCVNLLPDIQNTMLNRKGEMAILTKKVQSDANLMEAVRLITEKHSDLYKK